MGNALQAAVIYVPVLNAIFHTVPIPPAEALAIGAAGSVVLWVEEVRKLFVRRRRMNAPSSRSASGSHREIAACRRGGS